MNPVFITLATAFAISIYLTYRFLVYWRKHFPEKTLIRKKINWQEIFEKLKSWSKKTLAFLHGWWNSNKNINSGLVVELVLVALWSIIVGRPYLNFDPFAIPDGAEFSGYIQFHHLWIRAAQCGWCALWNGTEAGGFPAFIDLYGSALHPVVIITTLLLGVLNGAKLSLVVALWVAGISQWWLAYELKLGKIARLWSAAIAVAAGHVTGKMEVGSFGMTFSTAMISLVFASILAIYNGKGKKSVVLLGIVGASAILSGQGYFQAGLLGMMPAAIVLLVDRTGKIKKIWREYLIAFLLACLLAAPLIVPFAHFSPNFQKGTSTDFDVAQPLQYVPLNLVINDWDFYLNSLLGKEPYPSLYIIYIGWIPVMLAILGLAKTKQQHRPIAIYMLASIILSYLIASAILLKWLADILPAVESIRFAPVISGLSVPFILAFSAYGLEYLLSIEWPRLQYKMESFTLSTKWLLILPLALSINSVYQFSKTFIHTSTLAEDVLPTLSALQTDNSQWVNPPYGEQFFIDSAITQNLKVSPGIMPWVWRDRETPRPYLEASRSSSPGADYQIIQDLNGTGIYKNPKELYASITIDSGDIVPCIAQGTGGVIQVNCESDTSGILVVKENYYTGWHVQLNNAPAQLLRKGDWLSARSPAGKNIFIFRYLPWDVPLGIALSVLGIILCIRMWMMTSDKLSDDVPT